MIRGFIPFCALLFLELFLVELELPNSCFLPHAAIDMGRDPDKGLRPWVELTHLKVFNHDVYIDVVSLFVSFLIKFYSYNLTHTHDMRG